jgi:hypothetical protein
MNFPGLVGDNGMILGLGFMAREKATGELREFSFWGLRLGRFGLGVLTAHPKTSLTKGGTK